MQSTSNQFKSQERAQQELRTWILSAEVDLRDVEKEISQMVAGLDSLHSRRSEILMRLRLYQSATSPIGKLPVEILGEIFKKSTPAPPIRVPFSDELPHSLLAVCSRWRRIAHGMTELWHNIHVTYGASSMKRSPEHISEQASAVLSRSGSSALLHITVNEPCAVNNGLHTLLIMHFHRIKALFLVCDYSHIASFLASPPVAVESLRTVGLDVANEPLEPRPFTVFSKASRLTEFAMLSRGLRIGPKVLRSSTTTLQLPWCQLTAICLRSYYLESIEALLILHRCISVVTFDAQIGFKSELADTDYLDTSLPATVLLSNLTRLSIISQAQMEQFFARLQLPFLISFSYENYDVEFAHWDLIVVPFVTRCTRLTQLHLNCNIPAEIYHTLLSALPNLINVSSQGNLTLDTFQLIASQRIVPCLQSLEFAVEGLLDEYIPILEHWCAAPPSGVLSSPNSVLSETANSNPRQVLIWVGQLEYRVWQHSERLENLRRGGRTIDLDF
jgi:hypothetical protein